MTDAEFLEAFRRHKDRVYRFAYRMTGSGAAAEDIVQDCFVAYWRKPEAYRPERGALRPFLLGIARNLALKRREREHPHEELDAAIEVAPAFDAAEMERAEAVRRAVLALPALQREALILAEYEELSIDEIAAATSVEVAAVKSRLHRARVNLRRILQPLFQTGKVNQNVSS